ncbi:MAG TPA: hypothetical protein VMS17_31770 [Gemmataceae bacterium]|nr:hypothetical protein [Gemmataceae bacterium]
MNAPQADSLSHSADVRIHLHVNGYALAVSQLGPQFLVLRNPVDHPPCDAEIAMSIDGQESRWAVHLPNGVQVGRRKIAVSHPAGGQATPLRQCGHDPKAVENGQSALPI